MPITEISSSTAAFFSARADRLRNETAFSENPPDTTSNPDIGKLTPLSGGIGTRHNPRVKTVRRAS